MKVEIKDAILKMLWEIATWFDNDCIDPVEQMNEIVMSGYFSEKALAYS